MNLARRIENLDRLIDFDDVTRCPGCRRPRAECQPDMPIPDREHLGRLDLDELVRVHRGSLNFDPSRCRHCGADLRTPEEVATGEEYMAVLRDLSDQEFAAVRAAAEQHLDRDDTGAALAEAKAVVAAMRGQGA